jgi:hypothetical protein
VLPRQLKLTGRTARRWRPRAGERAHSSQSSNGSDSPCGGHPQTGAFLRTRPRMDRETGRFRVHTSPCAEMGTRTGECPLIRLPKGVPSPAGTHIHRVLMSG